MSRLKTISSVCTVALSVLLSMTLLTDASAMNKKKGKKKKGQFAGKMKRQAKAPYDHYEQKGLFTTGLTPVFPAGVECPPISSPYGSKTRYDGSSRNNDHHGYHNGMDISLDAGTPVLSVADGDVIHKGTAGQLVGSFVWLRYAPQDTGVPNYIFARYQHLDEPSSLNVGDKVKAGQTVGLGGNTGTTGGHFGSRGYPHLHLVFYTGPTADYTILGDGPMLGPKSLNYLDPMGLYLGGAPAADNHALRDLPDAQKAVSVPVKLASGQMLPKDAKLTWPLACQN